jgi:release factor glutamine methyltransferase
VPGARRDAEWLLAAILGVGRAELHLDARDPVTGEVADRFLAWCRRRATREPLQYILGSQLFRSLDLAVDRRVLIPRPETERIVDLCLSVYEGGTIVDVGTGSGAIALALALERRGERVVATDVSPAALEVATENARAVGARAVAFACGDLLRGLGGVLAGCSLVVCNPPYVASAAIDGLEPEVRDWEPRLALDGGPDGLDVFRRLAPEAALALKPGTWVVVEMGAGQQAAIEQAFAATRAFERPIVMPDYAGIARGLAFRRGGAGRVAVPRGAAQEGSRMWTR